MTTIPKCMACYKDGHGDAVWMFSIGEIDCGFKPVEVWLCPRCDTKPSR
jgi:hypothetical protein